jgi:copper homeostasis protein
MSILLEIAVDTLEDAVAAERGSAGRIELCSDLNADGLSPSADLLMRVRKAIAIPIHVMVRPRAGDFCYSEDEFSVMKEEVSLFRSLGANGIVTGILTPEKSVDTVRTAELVRLARPLGTTFHRAFDTVTDPVKALEDIISCGAERLLTSGQQKSAVAGLPMIRSLIDIAGGRISVMPGAGIDAGNVRSVMQSLVVKEIHLGKGVKRADENGIVRAEESMVRALLAELH